MAKNQIMIFFKKFTKSSKKRAFVRALRFRGKKPQGLCTLRFALKHTFNNTGCIFLDLSLLNSL